MSYNFFGEVLRSKISKKKDRYYRGRVGSTDKDSLSNFFKIFGSTEGGSEKTDKGSLARPWAVTGLTGARHRTDR
jgi:hypothetical protein